MVCILLGEITNPFNILRKVFDAQNKPDKNAAMGIWFIVLFVIVRVIICPVVGYITTFNPEISFILKFNCGLMSTGCLHSVDQLHLVLEAHEHGCQAAH